jgi:GR25 family glycosyltransferase involved in LPS biosynthesis
MIDHAYCINLERSKERRASAQKQFESYGLDVEMFTATEGNLEAPNKLFITKPEWGCAMSHVRIWRDIVEKGYETTLVFEDDIVLQPNFTENLSKILSELPPDWDYLNLGASPSMIHHLGPHSENISVGQSLLTHAYLINLKCAQKWALIDVDHLKVAVDTFISNYPSLNLYAKVPIVWQSMKDSSIGFLTRTYDLGFAIKKLGWIFILTIIFAFYIVWRYF